MALDPLAKVWARMGQIERLLRTRMLERSSITDGVMTFIRSTLRIKQSGRLELDGTVEGDGSWIWRGSLSQTGPTTLRGPVAITGQNGTLDVAADASFSGDVSIEETLDVSAETTLRDLVTLLSDLLVKTGGRIVLEGSPAIQIIPGTGSNPAQIRLGTGALDPVLRGGDGLARIEMPNRSAGVSVGLGGAGMWYGVDPLGGSLVRIGVEENGIRIHGIDDLPTGMTAQMLALGSNGLLYTWAGGTGGGPGDGIFAWPFSLDLVTSEFRTPQRPNHDGIDFGRGIANIAGTPIPSMGAGVVKTILAPGQGHGWGNGVVIDHGTDPMYGGALVETLYAHMSTAPAVAPGTPVALGQTLGPIGNTGNSFGNHLHFEVHVNGSPVNPRTFMAAHGG